MTMRYITHTALVLLIWLILGVQYEADADPADRTMLVAVGVVIAGWAILVSRRPSLPKSRDYFGGVDGGSTERDSPDHSHHGGDDGGGGHGGDGAGGGH